MAIHSLPFEILVEIFRLCFVNEALPIYPDPYGESGPSTHPHAAANTFPPPHVCKLWRNICSSSPQLYTTLSLRYEVGRETEMTPVSQNARLCTFLALTAPHPISVSFIITTKEGIDEKWYDVPEETLLAYGHESGLLRLLEHKTRWKSATISIPSPFLRLFFPEELTYPRLEKLDLHVYAFPNEKRGVKKMVTKVFEPIYWPNLRVITLQRDLARVLMFTDWRSGGSRIQVLILYGACIENENLGVLSACESLHTIHFTSCFTLPSYDPDLSAKRTLLPNVNTVSCSRLLPSDVRATPLAFLILPRLQHLQIQWNEALEEEVVGLSERSGFELKSLTLIQVPRSVYRPPTEQFISLLTRLSRIKSINQGLAGLELNHTDAKWDICEFVELMKVLSLGGLDDTHYTLFPFLKELTIAAYSIPDNAAFIAMLESRQQCPVSTIPLVQKIEQPLGLQTLRLRCPKSTFHAETMAYFGKLSGEGKKLYFEPWVGVTQKKWTVWNHQSYEVD
ncbi:hypothetical protein BDP27DRAFT_1319370 [Rhodocollybia butyracea]|uniref:F-box domain-containing protein n=1 Tax=Rhodocollybia butyracea TaxID=206335 RepID=A0A9P5UBH4_9AGAR|nr:hypothetical protein BDP27DRAFT_1319370 [Rhodocollybia butyracea]